MQFNFNPQFLPVAVPNALQSEQFVKPTVPAVSTEPYIVKSHLPAGFNDLIETDLEIKSENRIYPCHSAILGLHSKVLRDMFTSISDKSQWSSGVEKALEGFSPAAASLYILLHYMAMDKDLVVHCSFKKIKATAGIMFSRCDADVALEIARIAKKLDADGILSICERILLHNATAQVAEQWLPFATSHKMPDLQKLCMGHMLLADLSAVRSHLEKSHRSDRSKLTERLLHWQKPGVLDLLGAKRALNATLRALTEPDVLRNTPGSFGFSQQQNNTNQGARNELQLAQVLEWLSVE